jgi:hypothetical protein
MKTHFDAERITSALHLKSLSRKPREEQAVKL